MVVFVLTACPPGVRGDLSRWLLEVAPGVFVGHVSARVRERLWARVTELVKEGRAILVYSARNEQHLAFEVYQPDWRPVDCEGASLIKRPVGTDDATMFGAMTKGWSSASTCHRARRGRSR